MPKQSIAFNYGTDVSLTFSNGWTVSVVTKSGSICQAGNGKDPVVAYRENRLEEGFDGLFDSIGKLKAAKAAPAPSHWESENVEVAVFRPDGDWYKFKEHRDLPISTSARGNVTPDALAKLISQVASQDPETTIDQEL